MTEIVLSIIGGLVLFLFAVTNLSDVIKEMAGEKTKIWIVRFTSTIFSAIIAGLVITTLLDSSSAVIILAIVLVNAKMLTLRQAMGIVMGANIGTTISSQIIALNVGMYSPLFLLVGLLLFMISRNNKVSKAGKVVLYFGMLFFGLYTMERAVEPLKQHPYFFESMQRLDEPITGALVGAVVTFIIQSSSATVGMAIVLCKKGMLSLAGGIAVMLGAELGTCSDTLLATIKGSRSAIKTGIFHLLFNFICICAGLIFFDPFLSLVEFISANASTERSLANAHMLFNCLGVLIFMWFIGPIEKMLNKVLPDQKKNADTDDSNLSIVR